MEIRYTQTIGQTFGLVNRKIGIRARSSVAQLASEPNQERAVFSDRRPLAAHLVDLGLFCLCTGLQRTLESTSTGDLQQ